MLKIQALNAHQTPPKSIKARYRFYQKLTSDALSTDPDIIDFNRGLSVEQEKKCKEVRHMLQDTAMAACLRFGHQSQLKSGPSEDIPIFEHEAVQGLLLIPSLIPPNTQRNLLFSLMHQNLADERHKTNVHAHHLISYHATQRASSSLATPQTNAHNLENTSVPLRSFFNISPDTGESFLPLDPSAHKSITISQFLRRRLRWLTLGDQYDWTKKVYPNDHGPPFPEDIAELIHSLFPEMRPEAAIINLYSPGDTLGIHRDVSENSDTGLVSISLGCDGIFVAGFGDEDDGSSSVYPAHIAVRLRSGDAVYMTGPARFAWHGIPQVIANTCPHWLSEWPAVTIDDKSCNNKMDDFEGWRGWMSDKRVNLNIRQVKD